MLKVCYGHQVVARHFKGTAHLGRLGNCYIVSRLHANGPDLEIRGQSRGLGHGELTENCASMCFEIHVRHNAMQRQPSSYLISMIDPPLSEPSDPVFPHCSIPWEANLDLHVYSVGVPRPILLLDNQSSRWNHTSLLQCLSKVR